MVVVVLAEDGRGGSTVDGRGGSAVEGCGGSIRVSIAGSLTAGLTVVCSIGSLCGEPDNQVRRGGEPG